MTAAIEISNYSFGFGKVPVLNDVSISVQPGELFAIVGPNGAGKSTLLKCIMRILNGGTGSISVNGRPSASCSQKELARAVCYVPQGGDILPPFTVEEYVMMGRYPYLSPFTAVKEADRAAVREALHITGSEIFADRYLGTLSGGERQKVLIAAALAQGAGILLLDEPTTFLDPRHQDDIVRILLRVNRQSKSTIMMVTHDLNVAAAFSTRIVALQRGSVVFDGEPAAVMNNDVLDKIYGKRFLFAEHPTTGGRMIVPEVLQ